MAAFPGLGWRDVHCHRLGSGEGVAVVCQIDVRQETNISYYNSTSDTHHRYIPVIIIIIIITAFLVTLLVSIVFTAKFINKINVICFRVFYWELTVEW